MTLLNSVVLMQTVDTYNMEYAQASYNVSQWHSQRLCVGGGADTSTGGARVEAPKVGSGESAVGSGESVPSPAV